MAKQRDTEILRRKETVKAAVDLQGVPEGTVGRIMLSIGLTWIRYWVRFDNGVEMGSIHREKLVRAAELDTFLEERERALTEAPAQDETSEAGDAADDTSAGGGASVNGVQIPQLLLDRTQSALDRFGVSR